MRIRLIAVGTRMPAWVDDAFEDYARRLPRHCALSLVEIPARARTKGADTSRAVTREGERMLAAVPDHALAVALDEGGCGWTTRELAANLTDWMRGARDVALLVGGPDGLSEPCRSRARQCWSLSPLTLPHPLVRVVVAEQIYRAWSILEGHPYHR